MVGLTPSSSSIPLPLANRSSLRQHLPGERLAVGLAFGPAHAQLHPP